MSKYINTKEIKPGQLAEWRVLDPQTGKIVKRNRVRVLEQLDDDTWHVYHYGLQSCGSGWKSTELHPIN